MKVKLDMSEKLYVSTGESRDQVHFRFLNNSIFVTENDVHMSNFPDLSIEVQKQMQSEEEFQSILGQAETTATTMWTVFILFIVLKLCKASCNMHTVLSTISFLQLLVHDKHLAGVSLPAPA